MGCEWCQPEEPALVSRATVMKYHRLGYLSNIFFFLLIVIEIISLRLRNGQVWPPSGLVSTEASLLGLDMAVSSWCLYMACLILTYEFQGGAQFVLQHFSNGHSMGFETGQAFIWWGKPPCHHFKLQPLPPLPPTICDFS